jgi:hypothetical protein
VVAISMLVVTAVIMNVGDGWDVCDAVTLVVTQALCSTRTRTSFWL